MRLIISDDFIGYHPLERDVLFAGSDNKALYQKNLNTQPIDWYYRNAQISYKRNSLGHRSKEISELDFDNYILTTGCSHTEGIGLEIEKTWSYALSKKLGYDYYNLGIGGSGIDAMMHNLIVWFNKYKKPKHLVIQWPMHNRFLRAFSDPYRVPIGAQSMMTEGPWTINSHVSDMLVADSNINYLKLTEELAKIQIKTFNVPHVHVNNVFHPKNVEKDSLTLRPVDYARDMGHFGIKSNENLADDIYKKINTTN